jgi:hypothetical protein
MIATSIIPVLAVITGLTLTIAYYLADAFR